MSGGHFDYDQYKIDEIANTVDDLIKNNKGNEYSYPENVINEFKLGKELLQKAAIYAQRIDWLICGDDEEDSFIERLQLDLDGLKEELAE